MNSSGAIPNTSILTQTRVGKSPRTECSSVRILFIGAAVVLFYPGNSVSSLSQKGLDTCATSLSVLCEHLSVGFGVNQFGDAKANLLKVGTIITLIIAVTNLRCTCPQVQRRGCRARKSSAISSRVTKRTPSWELMYSAIRSSISRTWGRPLTSGWMVIGKTASSYSR